MQYKIVKVEADNYSLFDDMIYWRTNGFERKPIKRKVHEDIIKELANPNLHIYAVETEGKYVGWISIIYLPKVGKFNGHGHIYVDELWIEPNFRKRGYAMELMKKADELSNKINTSGIRLYVNAENPNAKALYEKCGYESLGLAYFMEK